MTLKLGTRGSALALWQAHHIRDRLEAMEGSPGVEIVVISTKGDRILDRPLAAIGGKGLFVKEIEVALANGEIDLAVHSLKDMPTAQPPGLELVAFPTSASPFDGLCGREPMASLTDLPQGARVGTGSLRRGAQLKALRPDIEVVGIRGNVQTRLLRRFEPEPGLDAVVLARAGLDRLELWEDGFLPLEAPAFLPAPGQGVLAVETRADDPDTRRWVDQLDDREARLRVTAERSCLAGIEGNCHTPFAAFARIDGDALSLHARLMDEQGGMVEGHEERAATIEEAKAAGRALAARLLGGA